MKRLILSFLTLTVPLYFSCTKKITDTPNLLVVSKDSLLAANNLVVNVASDGSLKWQTVEYTPVTSSPVVLTRQGKAYHGSISGMAN